MEKQQKHRIRVAAVALIMAVSVLAVVVVAWLGDGRPASNEPETRVGVAQVGR